MRIEIEAEEKTDRAGEPFYSWPRWAHDALLDELRPCLRCEGWPGTIRVLNALAVAFERVAAIEEATWHTNYNTGERCNCAAIVGEET